ncbi:aspartyl/asparaginyl beta-hydroxylase domain-containing protein [Leptolyngbya sp. FACHB-541]|uniref:aspartyl/asparaginyl beta-hydroxylase domain-containing protein n=1 Tax=Leptolyngbya sp. FACHB-541 TaxID=2692810 RepID=UPI0016846074|nr:aspartyl/asparaginyl beta-hydroxylase domain-containing protein [Leptolyngbya sp. FACHB-541]MBD1999211.1 aspartyl/asparaginyl beta-hydroxylase domain-containing protein [Leptolyngbya sp. FACHB-541]
MAPIQAADMIKILLKTWELLAWMEILQYVVSTVFARFLGQPQPQPPQLFGSPKPLPTIRYSFYPSSEYAFVDLVEANWRLVLSELRRLENKGFFSWEEELLREGSDLFELYVHGIKIEENCRLCPETTHLIERIPNLVSAGFLLLAPSTHTASSTEPIDDCLHCHLGLITPNQCGVQIEEICQTWREGRCLIFDNTAQYQMWNWSDRPRVVLLIDFKVPAELLL